MAPKFKNKKVLITAGPTWVPIDRVRVISNIATGATGILLAEKLQKLGARVTLLLGPVETCCLDKRIRLIHFRFFDELKRVMATELSPGKYDIVIHSAAVADYRLKTTFTKKVRSGIRQWQLKLVPTPKLIDIARKIDKNLFLVGFKFEPAASRKTLIKKANGLMRRAKLDLVVANTIYDNRYQAYIVNQDRTEGPFKNKEELAKNLIKAITITS